MKVLVAAGQASVRDRVAAASDFDNQVSIATVARAGEILNRIAADDTFDLVLLDFDLPGLSGLKGIQTIVQKRGRRPLGLLMAGGSVELAGRVFNAGATGVLPRHFAPHLLPGALRILADGHYLSLFDTVRAGPGNPAAAHLSERELQVLRGLCDGLQNKEIAHGFAVKEVTVKMHVRAIIRKLGARNRTHAAMIARDNNIV